MLGNSSSGSGLVIHSTHWSTLWVHHISSSDCNQYSSQSNYKWITDLLEFIPMSDNSSSANTPIAVTTATDISGSHAPWVLLVLYCFEGPPINLTGGRFITGTSLSQSMFSFVNKTTAWRYAPSFTIDGCSDKKTSIDEFSVSLFLQNSVALLYRDSMSHSHIILAGRYHITSWYCNNLARHLCNTWCTLASDSKNFCSTLKSDSTVNYDPPKYFLNFPMSHLTAYASPTKLCLDFHSGDNVDIDMKEISHRLITSRNLSNSKFLPSFSCDYDFLASSEKSACKSTAPIPSLDHYVLM